MKPVKTTNAGAKSSQTTLDHSSELGDIRVHDNVISSLVRRAALSIEGVSRLAGSTLIDNIAEIVGSRRMQDRAIAIIKDESSPDRMTIEVKINLKLGFKVREVAEAVQKTVVEQVEKTTGMTVTAVTVLVQEIDDGSEDKGEEEEEENEAGGNPQA